MKKLLIFVASLILLAVFNPILAQNKELTNERQWVWQNPVPTGNPLGDVWVFDETTSIIVGQSGTIMKTTNGGESWDFKESGTINWLHTVYFADNEIGWCAGDNGTILKTTDGGRTWIDQSSVIYTGNITSVFAIDKDIVWVLGAGASAIKTIDGGNTWTETTAPNGSEIFFSDNLNGWIANAGNVYRTTDGGINWEWSVFHNSGSAICNSVYFVDANTGWAVGGDAGDLTLNIIKKSTDGGITWVEQSTGVTGTLEAVYFSDLNTGWTVCDFGGQKILYTSDGGNSWIIQESNSSQVDLNSIRFAPNNTTGWIVGGAGLIFKTDDAGINWQKINKDVTPVDDYHYLYSVDFVNDTAGWAFGGIGTILKTTNSGNNWDTLYNGIPNVYLQDGDFINNNTGWAVGNTGTIIKTTDGGSSWISQNSGITTNLNSVFFLDESTGWAVGHSGKILKTTDSGVNWISQTSGGTSLLKSVYFIDQNTGFACGANKVYKTIDGGTTWTNQTVAPTGNILYSLYFVNTTTGWVVGNKNYIYKTSDAGASWILQTSGSTASPALYSVFGFNVDSAIVVGQGGVMKRTSDGGNNWVDETKKTVNNLWAVNFANDSTGWVAGSGSAILYYGGMKPLMIRTTGSGSYCEATGGLPVGLENSENGVVYSFYKDEVLQGSPIVGTGAAISFGNQLEGTYIVKAENDYGITVMEDAVVITEIPLVANGNEIFGNTLLCFESENNMFYTDSISNASEYLWTLPQGFNITGDATNDTIYVSLDSTAVTANIYVQGANMCGTGAMDSLAIEVIQAVEADFSTDDIFIIINDTVFLNDSSILAGAWQWSFNPNNGYSFVNGTTDTSQNPVVVFTQSGDYDVTLQASNACGSDSQTKNDYITVNNFVTGAVSSQNDSICIGESTGSLVLSGFNGMVNNWQKRHNQGDWTDFSNTDTVYEEIPSLSGIWDYRAVITNGPNTGYSNFASIVVKSLPQQASIPTGEDTLDMNSPNTTYFISTINGATAYQWQLNPASAGSLTPLDNIVTVDWNNTFVGEVWVSVHGINQCGAGAADSLLVTIRNIYSDIITYSIANQVSSSMDSINHTVSVLMPEGTNASNLIATFELSAGATAFVDGTMQQSGVSANDFTEEVVYNVVAENGTDSTQWLVSVDVEGIENLNQYGISVYPNPTQGMIYLSQLPQGIVKVEIANILGEILYNNVDVKANQTIEIDLSNNNSGIYYIRLFTKDKILTHKIILD